MDKNIRIHLFRQLPFSQHTIEDEVSLILKEVMENVLLSSDKRNQGAGDMELTSTGAKKIQTKQKRSGWIKKTCRRVKRAAAFLCCVRCA